MKKSIALLLAIIIILSLSACKSEKAPEETTEVQAVQSESSQKFPKVIYSDDKYTLTALSYSPDEYDDYGLELKFENKSDAKANLDYDGYIIANGYAITGLTNLKTEPGETATDWLTLKDEDLEISGLTATDIVQLKVKFEVYLPDSGDTVPLGDEYNTIQFGNFSEDKIPAPSVGTEVIMDRDNIVVRLVKSEVDWTGDKVYYLCVENNTSETISFSSYSATINGTSECEILATNDFPIPAGTKSVEKLSISKDKLAEINLTPETVTSITTSFRFVNKVDTLDFTSDDITINA